MLKLTQYDPERTGDQNEREHVYLIESAVPVQERLPLQHRLQQVADNLAD